MQLIVISFILMSFDVSCHPFSFAVIQHLPSPQELISLPELVEHLRESYFDVFIEKDAEESGFDARKPNDQMERLYEELYDMGVIRNPKRFQSMGKLVSTMLVFYTLFE